MKKAFGWILIFILALVALGVVYFSFLIKSLPLPQEFDNYRLAQSTKIYDRTGTVLLYEIHGQEKRTVIKFSDIPKTVIETTLAIEDADFYHHPAFDFKTIIRALWTNLKEGHIVQGGSTITQQLAKNIFLTPEKTLSRKIKELILAIRLESLYSKDQILEFYLNQIPYGSNIYGIESAAQNYFHKSAKDLTLAEAALLASLPKAPSYFSPWGNHLKELEQRKNYILSRLVDLKYIDEKTSEEAKKEKIKIFPPSAGMIKAPHFVLMVKDYLINRYGEDLVERGGLKVITSLDWRLQQIAERVVKEGAERNTELYQGKNAALVAEDPKTGQILALVGSKDYFDIKNEGNFNAATQALRQPGSALKPFVYLLAFQKGYPVQTQIFDLPTEFDTTGDPNKSYAPSNFDNKFRGPVSFEEALAQSINVPAVKVLYLVGVDNVISLLHRFGITTLSQGKNQYGLSLVLGGGAVKLIDLVKAYSVLSQDGIYHEQSFILKVEDNQGKVLEKYQNQQTRVFDPQPIRLINQILKDKDLRAPLFQNSLDLTFFPDYDVALKTGTSEDYHDAWAFGYSPFLVVGVWAGNNDNSPLIRHGGSILAAVPIWSAFLKEALKYYPKELFEKPEPLNPVLKPMLNGQFIYKTIIDNKTVSQIHSILFYVDKNNPLGDFPSHPENDPQFFNWEKAVSVWAQENFSRFFPKKSPSPPTPSFFNRLSFLNVQPQNGDFVSSPLNIKAEIRGPYPLKNLELYWNHQLLDSRPLKGNSFRYSYQISFSSPPPQGLIELKATDQTNEVAKVSMIVFFK